MGMNRDKKTNITLSILADLIDDQAENSLAFPITLVVGGQIITGQMISEEDFYGLEENRALKPIYDIIAKEKATFFNKDGSFTNENITEDEINKIPDTIWQRFIYLNNARYLTGSTFSPSENVPGSAIQVRLSDVMAFNFGTFSTKSE